jgi:DNA-binding MarR family transcriptional regulator
VNTETTTGGDGVAEYDPPWLTPDQQRDWRALIALVMTLPTALDAQLKRDAGVNSFEYHVLAALSEAPDRTRFMSDLAALAQGSLSRISHAVARLERSGWVERRSVTDRGVRRIEARLTDAGLTKIEEIAPGHVREAHRLVLDVLSAEQFAALGQAARAITATAVRDAPTACREIIDC